MQRVVVVGSGGLAREFTAFFAGQCEIVGYFSTVHTEHAAFGLPGRFFPQLPCPALAGTDRAVVAIGTPAARGAYYQQLRALGFAFPSFVHASSQVAANALVQEGAIVSPGCVVSPGASVGKLCYLNFHCGVGHDAVLGDFVQVNPGAQLGGWVQIGRGSLVGSGATVLERVVVGAWATIASGAVVFARVADGATVMGNPARRMRALERPRPAPPDAGGDDPPP